MDESATAEDRRRALEERRARLQQRIVDLEQAVAAKADAPALADLGSARVELLKVMEALRHLEVGEGHDPIVVEMGDTVTVREQGSSDTERYKIVGPVEARVDDSRISAESPLGAALLGRRPSETVTVDAPAGSIRYAVVFIERP
jgi:transcription elongation GreA/GreB family factor